MLAAFALLGIPTANAGEVDLEQRITPEDPGAFNSFGFDVAIDGERALVGAPSVVPSAVGSAYLFKHSDSVGWTQAQELTPSDGVAGDRFGDAVALEGDVLAVGARSHCHEGALGCGAVYIWRSKHGGWVFEQEILPPEEGINFGRLVQLHDGRLLIRQSGAAFIYTFDGNTWTLEQTFPGSGTASAALHSEVLVVGAPFDDSMCDGAKNDPKLESSGIAFVYRFNGTNWVEEQALGPSDADCWRWFGASVAVSGDTILATARNPTTTYVFEYDESLKQWIETAILPVGPNTGIRPRAAAIQGNIAIIGDDHSIVGQKAYVYQRQPDGTWIERAVLEPESADGSSFFFGRAVSIHGHRAIVGAHGEDQQSGAAYIFDLSPLLADLNGDGAVNAFDLLILLGEWGDCADPTAGNCLADFNDDGAVDVFDLLILLGAWG